MITCEVISPIHAEFSEFLKQCGEGPHPIGEFFEALPYLNLLLCPEPVKFERRNPLVPKRFQYLEGCVCQEAAYDIPTFDSNNDDPRIYLSFDSLGCGDTELLN